MAENLVQKFLVNQSTPTVVLKQTLDAQATRQRAHAQNIANAETPGYRRVQVEFESQLKAALEGGSPGGLLKSDPRHLGEGSSADVAGLKPRIAEETPDPENPGFNGVNIDLEMAEMAETQIRYLASLELLKRRYQGLKAAIRGTSQ